MEELEPQIRKEIIQQQESMCDLGERVLGLCRMQISKKAFNIQHGCDLTLVDLPMESFCFIGMTGIYDNNNK